MSGKGFILTRIEKSWAEMTDFPGVKMLISAGSVGEMFKVMDDCHSVAIKVEEGKAVEFLKKDGEQQLRIFRLASAVTEWQGIKESVTDNETKKTSIVDIPCTMDEKIRFFSDLLAADFVKFEEFILKSRNALDEEKAKAESSERKN